MGEGPRLVFNSGAGAEGIVDAEGGLWFLAGRRRSMASERSCHFAGVHYAHIVLPKQQ